MNPLRVLTLLCGLAAISWAQAPRIFYSDLESGPATGGENNNGAFVTVYGAGFGGARGASTVTVGGQAVAGYPAWTDSKVTFQLGPAAASGEIRVVTGAGTSNGVPFTVRAGNIRFVAVSGSDSNVGSISAPWRTVQKAVSTIAAGDVIYVMNGVVESRPGTSDGSVSWTRNDGLPNAPKALVAYPNAVAVIGSPGTGPCASTACTEGLKVTYASNYWTVAGLTLRGNNDAVVVRGTGWRLIGNDLSCPYGDGPSACLTTSQANNIKVLGNNVHESGHGAASALYHGVYFSTDSNNIELGWNQVTNTRGCRAVQVHSTALDNNSGYNQYGIIIHDNKIVNSQCDGIVLATVDPSRGPVQVFNNLIVNAGQGPGHVFDSGNFACIYVAGYTGAGAVGVGTVEVFNNTLVNCGGLGRQNAGIAFARRDTQLSTRLRNNILSLTNGTPYFVTDTPAVPFLTGFNNLFSGSGAAPAGFDLSGSISADPLFVGGSDFHLRAGSPARGSGVDAGLAADLDGRLRTAPHDIGAYVGTGGVGTIPGGGSGSFSLSPQVTRVTGAQAMGAAQLLVTVTSTNGFTGLVNISCVPQGLISCIGTAAGAGQTGTLTLTFPGAAVGTYLVTLQGTGGGQLAQAQVVLEVTAGSTPGGPVSATGYSLLVRGAAGWASAEYARPVTMPEYRLEFRIHGMTAGGSLLQTNAGALGSITASPLGAGYRLVFANQTLFFGSAACTLDVTAADAIVRLERDGFTTSFSATDPAGNAVGAGQCAQTVAAPTAALRTLRVGDGANGATFSLAWLRLQRREFGAWTDAVFYEFENTLESTPAGLAEALTWQGSEAIAYVATGGSAPVGDAPPVTGGSFEVVADAVRVTRGAVTASSTVRILPLTPLPPFTQVTVDCPAPPLGLTCALASPAVGSTSVLTLAMTPQLQAGTYRIALRGRTASLVGAGVLVLTVDAGGFTGGDVEFGRRSLAVTGAGGHATVRLPAGSRQWEEFRLEARIQGLNANGLMLRSESGSALGTIDAATTEDGGVTVRVNGWPLAGACALGLTQDEARDFVLRLQRTNGVYAIEAWTRSGGQRIAGCQQPGAAGALPWLGLSGLNGTSFQVAWLRLYEAARTAAPLGTAGAGVVEQFEFEDSLASGTSGAWFVWAGGEAPVFADTAR